MSELQETSNSHSIEEREGGFVCLVDGEGSYNLSEDSLKELISYVDPKGTQDYSIVGIMGCQSSGKSTLLNKLFETKFQMMDSDRGRQQTTKGIWLDAARNTNNLVIMDLEGTDSGERGEDRTTFERQTILYGLALCEVLIVNMWENDIGRYTASNYGVLKTVFEVNLQLFKQQGKTMLLFIVRDHIELVTPFDRLKTKLLSDVQNIWNELRKPDEFKDANIFDFFDFRFEALPHKILMASEFDTEAELIRDKFINESNSEYFFNTDYHRAKSVPAEGFAKYSHGIWETIRSNKDLNLPSQKEMLATFRCDELSTQAISKCLVDIAPVKVQSASKYIPDIGKKIGAVLSSALQLYDEGSSKYAPEVVSLKRKDLLSKLMEPCDEILSEQLRNVIHQATIDYANTLRNALPEKVPTRSFYDILTSTRETALVDFNIAKDSLFKGLPEGCNYSLVKTLNDLKIALDRCDVAARKDQFDRLLQVSLAKVKESVEQQLNLLLRQCSPNMWEEIGKLFASALSSATTYAFPYLHAFKATDTERHTLCLSPLLQKSEQHIYEIVSQHSSILNMKLRQYFENIFLKDEQGLRRRWTSKDDIRALFIKSRDETLNLIPLFSRFELRKYWGEEADDILMPSFNTMQTSKKQPFLSPSSILSSQSALSPESILGTSSGTTESEHIEEEKDTITDMHTPSKTKKNSGFSLLRRTPSTMVFQSPSIILLSADQTADIQRQFLLEIDNILSDAQREQERQIKATSLPPWAILVMLILGYNEIMALLRNPLVLVLVVVLGFLALIVHSLGMTQTITTMIKNSLFQAYDSFQVAIAPSYNEVEKPISLSNVPVVDTSKAQEHTDVSTADVITQRPKQHSHVKPD